MTEFDTFEGPRGLRGYLRMATTYGEQVELQQSSAAVLFAGDGSDLDGPFAWLRIKEKDGTEASAHLSVDQMKALRRALKDAIRVWDTSA